MTHADWPARDPEAAREISRDAPLPVDEAAALRFGDAVSPYTLRQAIRAGRLDAYRIGRAYFTTLENVDRWWSQCRVQPKARASNLSAAPAAPPPGSSGTASTADALAAARESARRLKERSANISRKRGSHGSGVVVPLTSRSPTS